MSKFYYYRPGERAYLVTGQVVSLTKAHLEFRTLANETILVRATDGELDQFDDQGIPAQVEVFQDGEPLLAGKGYYLPLSQEVFLVVDV